MLVRKHLLKLLLPLQQSSQLSEAAALGMANKYAREAALIGLTKCARDLTKCARDLSDAQATIVVVVVVAEEGRNSVVGKVWQGEEGRRSQWLAVGLVVAVVAATLAGRGHG